MHRELKGSAYRVKAMQKAVHRGLKRVHKGSRQCIEG